MANLAFRKLHRQTALIVFIPLLLTALTGLAYGLGESWFGISDDIGEIFLNIHQGSYLGKQLRPIYVILLGVGLLGMVVTGLTMTKFLANYRAQKSPSKINFRLLHRWLAPIVFLPLIISAITGIGYRVGRTYFGLQNEQAEIFLEIHQGEYFGDFGKSIYVLFVGLGLLVMLVTGIKMTSLFVKRRTSKPEEE